MSGDIHEEVRRGTPLRYANNEPHRNVKPAPCHAAGDAPLESDAAIICWLRPHRLRYVYKEYIVSHRTRGTSIVCQIQEPDHRLCAGRRLAPGSPRRPGPPIRSFFAAASTKDAIAEIANDFAAAGKGKSSPPSLQRDLAKQIETGAGQHLISATAWGDYLDKKSPCWSLAAAAICWAITGPIAPADSTMTIDLSPGRRWPRHWATGKLAVCDPESVPADATPRLLPSSESGKRSSPRSSAPRTSGGPSL